MSKLEVDRPRLRLLPLGTRVAWVAALLVLAAATAAKALPETSAMTLEDLANGAQLISSDGKLTFGGFDIALSGVGPLDLEDYAVWETEDGFGVSGSKGTGFRGLNISLAYDVTVMDEFAIAAISVEIGRHDSVGINGARLRASSGEDELGTALWRKFSSKSSSTEIDDLGEGVSSMSALESIVILAGDDMSEWSSLRSFASVMSDDGNTSVPEPSTAMMLGLGLVCLASFARNHSRRSRRVGGRDSRS